MKHTRPAGPQLIAYADRCGGSVSGLRGLLEGQLEGVFGGVHLLPYFTPFDGVDAGFDPEDHTAVDPRLGTWGDIRELSASYTLMSDVIVNHVSARSERFTDVVAHGDDSPWAPMFLTLSSVFPKGASEEDLARIYRPRPGLPFTAMTWAGKRRLVWTTFTPEQIDIDLTTPQAWAYIESVVDALTNGGVTMLRLDAIGYTGKEAGTDCFMTPATERYTQRIAQMADERGAQVLLEVHGHHSQQIEIARSVDYVYDFALPPLVLHALHAHDLEPLAAWFAIRPANSVTVLDTHDGIGIVDVGESDLAPGVPGLLSPDQIDALVNAIHRASHGTSLAATGAAASNLDLYQVNCTFYDALGRDDDRYLLARLIQLMTPGIPQVYYVGLLAGSGDMELLERTGVGRNINRHHYSVSEIEKELERPVVAAQVDAIKLRNSHPAFEGEFAIHVEGTRGSMRWERGSAAVTLEFDVRAGTFELTASSEGGVAVRQELGASRGRA
ncbi:sucrose phosphorylase [Demequina lutea]|uniref:Sucrose phosphorylase n=1 Tax=Demequina lutea TaxID=431489 RepID=A0A7Y9Z9K6_9MICO|nr:sucrose phosphorylase [Demequina lutea]NYI40015.1 sucrose phosphorylase [Demequina lutea]